MSEKQVVYVAMGGDHPGGVFKTLESAKAFCEEQKKRGPHFPNGSSRIFWRALDFNLED